MSVSNSYVVSDKSRLTLRGLVARRLRPWSVAVERMPIGQCDERHVVTSLRERGKHLPVSDSSDINSNRGDRLEVRSTWLEMEQAMM